MGTFASVTLPYSARAGSGSIVSGVVAGYPGTRTVTLAPTGDSVTFELHFPGNLDGLVARLATFRIAVGALATISIPVEVLAPEHLTDPSEVAERLNNGPAVWDPEFTPGSYVTSARFTGTAVEASILPCTNAVHELYDSMMHLGLTARGVAPAGAP